MLRLWWAGRCVRRLCLLWEPLLLLTPMANTSARDIRISIDTTEVQGGLLAPSTCFRDPGQEAYSSATALNCASDVILSFVISDWRCVGT